MTKRKITEADGWLIDGRNNRSSIAYFGSRDAAEKALLSLKNCRDCTNCSDCSRCSGCSGCSRCSNCSGCSGCSGCSDCSRCSGCSDCSDCSRCSGCSDCSRCYKAENVNGEPFSVPVIPDIHRAIYTAASQPESLEMGSWHKCANTHCRGGWVVALAGEEGRALETRFNTELAAMLIYRESGYPINPARFYDSNAVALADMKRLAETDPQS